MTRKDRIIEVLQNLAPNHPVTRVWGRLEGSTPEQAAEGNAWAADVEDLANLIIDALDRP